MEEAGKCRDCGAPVIGRAWYCPACRKIRNRKIREKCADGKRAKVTCVRCGKQFETIRWPGAQAARYCPDCHHLAAGENRKAKRISREAAQKQLVRKLPGVAPMCRPLLPEPKGSKNSLDHVVWEIEVVNRRRVERHQPLLTYGKYIPFRDKLAKELKSALEWARKTQRFYKDR